MVDIPTTQLPSPAARVLVSGASGMIGTALVRSWMADPIHLIRLIRGNDGRRGAAAESETVVWDPTAARPIAELERLSGLDAVVHLSGANVAAGRWTEKYKREIVSSRVQTTQALVKALTQVEPPKVLVCASAIGIYGDRGDEILTESSTAGKGFLAETCVAWEAAAEAAQAAGVRVVHARFGVVLSPQGGALAKMLPLFRLGVGGKLGDGRQWMPWVTLRDAVGILRHCVDHADIRGPINVVAPGVVTNAEFTRALGAAVHRPAVIPAPAFALRLAFGEMADEALLASARVAPVKLDDAGYEFHDPEIRAALGGMLSS